ncbi:signal peptidase II [Rathayibacter soli]|uniref:signal peptidase II n=1 Tax=Rathayibacter soli TaxID=3144168 RepID=UPI0027E44F43|nr:signal peptidase II [Glaciibacter superstes]
MAVRPRPKVSVRAIIVLTVVALVVLVIDQVAKFLVVAHLTEGVRVEVLGQLLQFYFVKNSGAAFSIGAGSTWIFTIIACAVLVFVIWFARRIRSIGWAILFGLLLGGLLGNLTDRLTRAPGFGRGEVVDFLQIPLLPAIFNLADVAIVSSMVLFLILTMRGVSLDGTRHGQVAGTETEDATEPGASADAEAEPRDASGDSTSQRFGAA